MANATRSEQEQYVAKANDLIRRTRYNMSTQQQKIVLYAISKIRPEDSPGTEYTINVKDMCKACGIPIDREGLYYKIIKTELVSLTEQRWVKLPNGEDGTVGWLAYAKKRDKSGTVTIKFHDLMAPYLFELRSHYTQYQLANALVLKGKHAIRLYELLRSYYPQRYIDMGQEKDVRFSLTELRELLAIDDVKEGEEVTTRYPRWSDFETYVLRKAVTEINKMCSEFRVNYQGQRGEGRTICNVLFTLTPLKALDAYETMQRQNKRLTKGL